MKKIRAYVINHGHMDIEWYQPLLTYGEWFRKSIGILDEIVKKEDAYRCYVYDGAVFPVLYATRRDPSLRRTVEELAATGKLKLGPFYTQFDEFLACGESIIRNCLWGDRKSRELYGTPMKAGYLLDNFGHPAQLPQILCNFGIKSLFFSRGMCDIGDGTKEFLFRAPDGSAVCAMNFSYSASFRVYENNAPRASFPNYLPYYEDTFLTYGYHTDIAKHIDHEGIAKQLIEGVKANAGYYPSGIVPVFAGSDHCPPQEGLSETVALAGAMQDEIEFIFTDAEALSDALWEKSRDMVPYTGDLIGSKYDLLLFGAMTTRIFLKQKMYACEHLLFDYALPLAAYAKYCGEEDTQDDLDEATEMLLLNSTHDSIHGSGVDAVHRENEYRFDRAAQLCAASVHHSLDRIARHLGGDGEQEEFLVYSPRDFDGYITAWINTGTHGVLLTDGEGNRYETAVLPKTGIPYTAKGEPYCLRPVDTPIREVTFRAALSAGEVKKFFYRAAEEEIAEAKQEAGVKIENEAFRLELLNGHLYLTDKAADRTLPDFLSLTEEADTGDAFDYSSPWKEAASYDSVVYGFSDGTVTDCGPVQILSCRCTMRVPARTVGDDRSDTLTDMPVTLVFRLCRGIRRLDIDISVANRSENHRVRAVFAFPFLFDKVIAGETFCTEAFPVRRPPMTADWWEQPTKELPFRDRVSVSDGISGYTVAARGLYVFEPAEDGKLAFTLFRSIGELMRIHLKNRAGCCAAGFPVPEAQCLRDMSFSFALLPYDAGETPRDTEAAIEPFVCPPAVHPIRKPEAVTEKPDSMKPFFFRGNASFTLSVFGQSYNREFYVLRFYEANGQPAKAVIALPTFSAVYLSDMNETVGEPLTVRDGTVTLDVPANKIITLLLKKE